MSNQHTLNQIKLNQVKSARFVKIADERLGESLWGLGEEVANEISGLLKCGFTIDHWITDIGGFLDEYGNRVVEFHD